MKKDFTPSLSLETLLNRVSTDDLCEPAPASAQLEAILSAALRAPDHGKCRPWRYVIITGEERLEFAHQVVEAMVRQDPDVSEKKKEKRFKKFSQMPMILALGMHLEPDHKKIPLWEQKMTIGAGAMNILNALYAEGFGGVWISGSYCEDSLLLQNLGFMVPDGLAGFIFIGTPENKEKTRERPDIKDYMAIWQKDKKISFVADQKKKD